MDKRTQGHEPVDLMRALEPLLLDEGYALNPRPIPEEIGALAWAWRKGRISDDYLFIFAGLDTDAFQEAYRRARKWANQQFKMPKALRFRVPHTMCVLVTDQVDGRLKRFVDKTASRTMWGGEVNHLLVVDRRQKQLHYQPAHGSIGRNELRVYGHVGFGERVLATVL